jgi:hypothetical protein
MNNGASAAAQEAVKLMPRSAHYLALCAKTWSDLTYMDEIHSRFREKLTAQFKQDVNAKAIEYSRRVRV